MKNLETAAAILTAGFLKREAVGTDVWYSTYINFLSSLENNYRRPPQQSRVPQTQKAKT